MSYEASRFSWQKLLVNQVPHATVGLGALQYASAIKKATSAVSAATKIVEAVQTSQTAIKGQPALAAAANKANNAKLQDALTGIDQSINQLKVLPPTAFGAVDKNSQINSLQTRRDSLAKLIATAKGTPAVTATKTVPTSTTTDSAADFTQATATTKSVETVGSASVCQLPLPVDPQPIVCVFPDIAVCLAPEAEFWPTQQPTQNGQGTWVPTGNIDGIGTWTLAKGLTGYPPGATTTVYAADGKTYRSNSDVPAGVQWSYKPFQFVPNNVPAVMPPVITIPQPVLKQQDDIEFYKQQLETQTKQLEKLNRSFNRPVEQMPADRRYPTDSWQYSLWQKGYSLKEISWGEREAVKKGIGSIAAGDIDLFNARVEDLIQDGILAGQIGVDTNQEIFPCYPIGLDPNTGQPVLPPRINLGGGDIPLNDVIVPPILPVCGLPPLYTDPRTGKPADPRKIPPALRGDRNFISKKNTRPIDLEDMPMVRTCATNTVPTKNNWEDAVIGAGATVAELDTIRRTMAQTKVTTNANMADVAIGMLDKVRTQVQIASRGGTPGRNSVEQNLLGRNQVNNIQGVVKCGLSPLNAVKANDLAQKRTTQAVDTRSTRITRR